MKHLLKIGLIAIVIMLLPVALKAQTPTSSPLPSVTGYVTFDNANKNDTVTVGSRMPYLVSPQTPITGLSFEYKWLFSNSQPILSLAGAPLTAISNDYYTANEISAVMPSTPGNITIMNNVRSVLTATSTILCTGADSTNTIVVIARPTVNWAAGGTEYLCTGSASVSIPLTALTGVSQIEVAYTITYYNTFDKSGGLTSTAPTKYLVLSGTSMNLPASEFGSGDGVYEIEITGITDRISRKSLDPITSVAGELPADAYSVFLVPAPVTSPLQHVRNN